MPVLVEAPTPYMSRPDATAAGLLAEIQAWLAEPVGTRLLAGLGLDRGELRALVTGRRTVEELAAAGTHVCHTERPDAAELGDAGLLEAIRAWEAAPQGRLLDRLGLSRSEYSAIVKRGVSVREVLAARELA